jgi:DNA-binding transcriptional LysR family regulator
MSMDLAGLNLNLLVALEALLAERHVGRAARRVGVTQSAMSHTLRQLRELMDDPILVRAGNDMLPTSRAEEVQPRLQRGLADLKAVVSGRAAFDPSSITDTFTVAAHDGVAAVFTSLLFERLQTLAPRAGLRIATVDHDAISENLAHGRWDVALLPPLFPLDGLETTPLAASGVKVACRRDHTRIKKRLTLAAYCDTPHVMLSLTGEGSSWVDHLLASLGRTRRVALRTPYLLAMAETVSRSDLIVTLPDLAADYLGELWPLKSFPPPFEIPDLDPLLMVWHPRQQHEPSHRFFREQVRLSALDPRFVGRPRPAR